MTNENKMIKVKLSTHQAAQVNILMKDQQCGSSSRDP